MSELRVDTITDELGTGSPDFPNGITVSNATFGTIDITGSTIESTPIGQVTPAAGDFTTLSANSVNIDGGTIDGTAVNATTLTASGDVNFDSGTLFVDESTNRVGIGTTSPTQRLHLSGNALLQTSQTNTSASLSNILFRNSHIGYNNAKIEAKTDGQWWAGALTFSTASVSFANTLVEHMRITNGGNVGIGTTSPSTRLAVNASSAGQVVNWSDGAVGGYLGTVANVGADLGFNFNLLFTDAAAGNAERMRIDSSGNLLFNSGYGSVATAYGCRAWVNFSGTGTVAIRADGNVSSITDNGAGDYTVNFATAMPDANYASVASSSAYSSGATNYSFGAVENTLTAATTTSRRFIRESSGGIATDGNTLDIAIFR